MTKQLFNDSHIHINAGQVLRIANPNLDISPYSRVRVVIGLPNIAGLHLAFELDIMQGSGVLYQLDSFALAAAGKFNRLYDVPGLALNIRVQALSGSPAGTFGVQVYGA